MSEPLLVGLDVGTTNIKAVVVDPAGQTVAIASAPQEISYPRPGWAQHDPARVWDLCIGVLRDAISQLANPQAIAGLAIASMGEAGVTIDAAGNPTYDIIAWFDRRTVAQTDAFSREIDRDRMFSITGTELQPIMTAPKLMWLRDEQPDVWARTVRFLNVSTYIAFKLGAEQAQEHSLASRTGLFDLKTRGWHADLLEIAGLPATVFAPLQMGGTRIGMVSAEAAKLTGLPTGCVIGIAGHDHLCGAFAGGVIRRGDILDSIGTAEGLMVGLDAPIDDVAMGGNGFTQGAHVVPNQYYGLGAIYTAGASYEWARSVFAGNRSHDEILAGARRVAAGSMGVVFLPHLRLAMFPELDSRARGAFIGLTTDITTDAIIRAVLEGVAFEGRAGFGPLVKYAQMERVSDIKVIGGTARNRLLIEIKASVMNANQHVLQVEEATALGAAMLAGMASGIYRDADDAIANVSYDTEVIAPDDHVVAVYDAIFEDVYQHIYRALRPMHHALYDLFMSSSDQASI